jgi:hypothetical protein
MKQQSMNNQTLYELSWLRKLLSLVFLTCLLSLAADRASAQVTNAFDAASDGAYFALGAPNGLDIGGQNGGFGFGPWTFAINTPSGGAGGSFIENNGPSGNSFDLWNTGANGSTIATRDFSTPIAAGQSFTISLRFNGLNGGDTNRFALLDASGNVLFSYWHKGGDNNNGWYSDANNAAGTAVNFPYAFQQFQTFKFTLTSATTYTFTDISSGGSFTGTIANSPIAKFSLIRRNGSSAPAGGEDFQFDQFILVSAAPPSFLVSPAAGTMSVPTNAIITAQIGSGGVPLNTGSVAMKLDANPVTPTVTGDSSVLNVSYTPSLSFANGSSHTVEVVVRDNSSVSYTNTWSFTAGYSALPITLPGPFTTGGGVDLTICTATGESWLGTNYGNNSSQILYTRFSMAFNDLNGEIGGGGGYGGLQFFLGNTEKLILGNGWTSLNWSLDAAGSQQDLPGPIPVNLGEWHTFVVRTEYVPGGNDNVKVWFDFDFSQTEGNQPFPPYEFTCDASFDNIRLRCGNGTASATWTNIMIAPTAAGVGIPVAGPPTFQNLSPANGAFSVLTNTAISAKVVIGGNPVSAVSLTLDGAPVTITTNQAAGLITVNGQPSSALSAGSVHNAQLVVTDNTNTKYTNNWSFTTGFNSLPVTLAGPITTGGGNDLTICSAAGDSWLGTNYDNTSSKVLYTRYSMVFNDLNGEIGGGGGYGGLHFMLGNAQQLIVGNGWTSLNWSLDAAASQQDLPGPIPVTLGEWHTIIVRTDYIPGGNDTVKVIFDPEFDKPESQQVNVYTLSADVSFDNIRLRCGDGTASATWTNIIIGGSATAVGLPPEAGPTFLNFVPAQGAISVVPNSQISVRALFGGSAINPNAVSMTLDGNPVTPSFTSTPNDLTISYQPPTPFAAGSSHTAAVNLTDLNNVQASTTWSFTVDAYPALPVNLSGPVGVTGGGAGITIFSTQNGWLNGNTYLNTNYSGTIYTTFSMEFDDLNGETGGGGAFGGLHFYNGNNEKLLIGNNWGSVNWSYDAANWGSGNISDFAIVPGEWHTFVVKIAFVAGGPDNVSVWLDPNLSLAESGQTNAPVGILADASFDNIHVRAGNNTASASYSNIVISATSPFAASVPPGSLSIQGKQLSWTGAGVLQEASAVTGPWTDSSNQSNPQTLTTTSAAHFYRLRQ